MPIPPGVTRDTLKDDPGSPMIMLVVVDAEHRVDATALQVIETLHVEFPSLAEEGDDSG